MWEGGRGLDSQHQSEGSEIDMLSVYFPLTYLYSDSWVGVCGWWWGEGERAVSQHHSEGSELDMFSVYLQLTYLYSDSWMGVWGWGRVAWGADSQHQKSRQ